MKAWQIFLVGAATLVAALFLSAYERVIAAVGAIVIVSVVAFGFLARPRREVFHVRTTVYGDDLGGPTIEHDCVAIRVEVARLWLLFVPTFCAMAFLVQSAAEGTTWRFSLLHRFWATSPLYLHLYRIFFLIVVGILSTWISERWVLRDADARSAGSVSIRDGRVSYMFVDGSGEYHGGEGFPFRLVSAPELAALVLYNVRRPELNKIALGCLFHRFVIIGRGITDLDEATAAVPSKPVVSTT